MTESTKKWVGVGLVLAALFFVGSVVVMWLTDDTVEQDRGTPREPVDTMGRAEPVGTESGVVMFHPLPFPGEGSFGVSESAGPALGNLTDS